MKRDMDLIREILLEMEKSTRPLDVSVFVTTARPKEYVGYNIDLMEQAGLITTSKLPADNDPYYFYQVKTITWEGQEFLANVKDEQNWKKAKLAIAQRAGDVSFELLKTIVSTIAQKAFIGL